MGVRVLTGLLLLSLFTVGCRSRTVIDKTHDVNREGVARVWVEWVKDKGTKFDLNLHISNENRNEGIIIMLSDISCSRGTLSGSLKHTFFNTGERTIDFRANEHKAFNMVCQLNSKVTGDYVINIKKIYANPSGDGKTVGKVVAENVEWRKSDGRH